MDLSIQACMAGALIMLGGCTAERHDGRDAIAVSYEPQAWIVEQIAGDDLDVITLLPSGSDPETYQPSMSTMKRLIDAKVYLTLGTPGFEEAITQNISKNFPDVRIADCAQGVEKLYGTHGVAETSGHKDRDFDPHLLSSIRNCIEICDNITRTLAETYPERASEYTAAGKALRAKLTALDDSISRMEISGKSIAIRHPSLSYYARDYGLEQIALSESGKETSPKRLKERMDASASNKPVLMVVEMEHASPSDYETARALGVDTIHVTLNTATWLNDIMRISHEIDRD